MSYSRQGSVREQMRFLRRQFLQDGGLPFILAYNLIRTIIARAASKHEMKPRSISFKGVVQTLNAFQPLIAFQGDRDAPFRRYLYEQVLDATPT